MPGRLPPIRVSPLARLTVAPAMSTTGWLQDVLRPVPDLVREDLAVRVRRGVVVRVEDRYASSGVVAEIVVLVGVVGDEFAVAGDQVRLPDRVLLLRSVVTVEDRPVETAAPGVGGGFERVCDQLGAHVVGDRPARESPGMQVQHRCQIEELAISDGQTSDVADVLGVRLARGEVPLCRSLSTARSRLGRLSGAACAGSNHPSGIGRPMTILTAPEQTGCRIRRHTAPPLMATSLWAR